MVVLADIKNDLRGWPDELINEWLLYLANRDDTGWPPPEPLTGSWAAILGGRLLAWWHDVSWAKETVDCSPDKLAPKTRDIVTTIRSEMKSGRGDDVTKRRFTHALHYILHNGRFPNPVSGMKVDGRLLVLDGNHRVAALSAALLFSEATLQEKGWQKVPAEQNIWIGTHKSGEVPLT